MQELLSTSDLTKRFGELTAVDQVSYLVPEGQVSGVIGPNGSGKTTLFNLLSGYFPPSAGSIRFGGKDITALRPHERVGLGIVRSFQLVSVFTSLPVWENLVLAVTRFMEGQNRPGGVFFKSARRKEVISGCGRALERVGLLGKAEMPTASLSYGDKRMLEIAMALALRPKLLLLDEPLAGLSDHEIGRVMELISSLSSQFTLVIIEHKISKISGLLERLCVMNEGRIICEGDPGSVLADPEVRACYWGKEDSC